MIKQALDELTKQLKRIADNLEGSQDRSSRYAREFGMDAMLALSDIVNGPDCYCQIRSVIGSGFNDTHTVEDWPIEDEKPSRKKVETPEEAVEWCMGQIVDTIMGRGIDLDRIE